MTSRSVADIVGPWEETDWDSGLVARCRQSWNTPVAELSNEMLATFLRQDIAVEEVLREATKRIATGFYDDTEIYQGELAAAAQEAGQRQARRVP